jgi:hypothetical protein
MDAIARMKTRTAETALGRWLLAGSTLLAGSVLLAAGALLAGPVLPGTPIAMGADPASSFYYESDIGDGIGIGRTAYGQTGDADFVAGATVVTVPQTPYPERISFKLDLAQGERLVAGNTYTGGVNRTEGGGVRHRLCSTPSASAHYVHDVAYDAEGTLTMLSMSSQVDCGTDGTFHSEVRYNTVAPRYAGIKTEPDRYDRQELPSAAIGEWSEQHYAITAVGSKAVVFGSPTVRGANPTPFSVRNDTCAGGTFGFGQTCSLDVRFSPTARGVREADVRLALDSPSGHRDLRVRSTGQVPTTTTLSMKKGPYTSRVGITTRIQPVPDDRNGHCMTLVFTAAKETKHYGYCDNEEGKFKFLVDMPHARYKLQAVSIATPEFASSASEPRWARWVRTMGAWGSSKVEPATFYPYPDGYKDRLKIKGDRKFAIGVDIVITRVSSGKVVAEVSLPKETGAYSFAWNGQDQDGSGLAPYGDYDVAVTLTEDQWNQQTFHHQIKLKRQWVKWTKHAKTFDGEDYGLWGKSDDASISRARSAYARGVRLGSGRGVAVVEYAFPVVASSIYGDFSFKVQGRSPNRHQAMIAIWNPKRGGYRDLSNFDAAKAIGPRYRWWKTYTFGNYRVRNGKARAAVLVWKGLGKAGPAAFDIRQVRLVYKTGKLMSPSLLSADGPPAPSIAGHGSPLVRKRLTRDSAGQPWPWLKFVVKAEKSVVQDEPFQKEPVAPETEADEPAGEPQASSADPQPAPEQAEGEQAQAEPEPQPAPDVPAPDASEEPAPEEQSSTGSAS